MNAFLLLLLMLAEPAANNAAAQTAAPARRGEVKAYSLEGSKLTFRLYANGGAMEVRALDAADTSRIDASRGYIKSHKIDFAAGELVKPADAQASVPESVDAMKQVDKVIVYQYEELADGGRLRFTTTDPRGVEALHNYLKFLIAELHTGDSGQIE